MNGYRDRHGMESSASSADVVVEDDANTKEEEHLQDTKPKTDDSQRYNGDK